MPPIIKLDNDRPLTIEFEDAQGSCHLNAKENWIKVVHDAATQDWTLTPITTSTGALTVQAQEFTTRFGKLLGQDGDWRALEYVMDAIGQGSYSQKVAAAHLSHIDVPPAPETEICIDPRDIEASLDALRNWEQGHDLSSLDNEGGYHVGLVSDGGAWVF